MVKKEEWMTACYSSSLFQFSCSVILQDLDAAEPAIPAVIMTATNVVNVENHEGCMTAMTTATAKLSLCKKHQRGLGLSDVLE